MHVFLITGTSRGIGEALAYELLDQNHRLICLSRGRNEALIGEAEKQECPLEYHQVDLGNTDQLITWTQQILTGINPDELDSITLVQNAAALHPIQPIGREVQEQNITLGVNVNLLAPMLMTEAFVNQVQGWPIPKQMVNLSSGAARRPVHSWSMYCATKAALDMYSLCLAEEQQHQPQPVKVVSVAPGVVDTAMQDHLRTLSKEVFPGVQRFLDLKQENKLWSPKYVAEQLVKLINDPSFGEEVQLDLRLWQPTS